MVSEHVFFDAVQDTYQWTAWWQRFKLPIQLLLLLKINTHLLLLKESKLVSKALTSDVRDFDFLGRKSNMKIHLSRMYCTYYMYIALTLNSMYPSWASLALGLVITALAVFMITASLLGNKTPNWLALH